ncbi:MAG: hypothetical protein E8D44_05230 [Nitrospira sp.]|nr:MAG: hypothetical protein E8D44_05230 [Nitrospira sp.]
MITWTRKSAWVAVFDILGFRSTAKQMDAEFQRALLTDKLSDLLTSLENSLAVTQGGIEHLVISDTIVLFASSPEPQAYPSLLQACQRFIEKSIYVKLPLRGAISIGDTYISQKPLILVGPAFVEAFEFCEDQDWIGLLLTPSASHALKTIRLDPYHHDFVTEDLPLRNQSSIGVYAYRFQNGQMNFNSPLLPPLRDMQQQAPEKAKDKYERTIAFIQKHYRKTP